MARRDDRGLPKPTPVATPRPDRQIAFALGLSAESRASALLIAKGFRILAHRFKSPIGEIDIVARRRQLLVFVEVKARADLEEAAWSSHHDNNKHRGRPPKSGSRSTATTDSATFASTPFSWRPASVAAYHGGV